MAPVRRTRTTSTPQFQYPSTPPTSGDEHDDEYTPDQDSAKDPKPSGQHRTVQRTQSASMQSSVSPLQRGSACLSCRRRKMKCDGSRPVCQQCTRANRTADCEYDEGKSKTRTQLLQEKIQRLELRIQEMESSGSYGHSIDNPVYGHHDSSLDLSMIPDPRTDLGFTFGTTASGTQGYELRQLMDVASTAPSSSAADQHAWPEESQNSAEAWSTEMGPLSMQQAMLELVLPQLPRLGIDIDGRDLLHSLSHPASARSALHPSLINALYLHASTLAPPDHYLRAHQSRFLKRTQDAINASLELPDSHLFVDTLRAQCLLATWYIRMARTLEGYSVISTAARLAVGCGLNRIVSPVWKGHSPLSATAAASLHDAGSSDVNTTAGLSQLYGLGLGILNLAAAGDGDKSDLYPILRANSLHRPRTLCLEFGTGLLPGTSLPGTASGSSSPLAGGMASYSGGGVGGMARPTRTRANPILDAPKDAKELGQRILLFWRIFNLDRFWSIACGMQPSLSEDEIMTVWPRTMDDYVMGNVNDSEYASLRSLGVRSPQAPAQLRPDAPLALLSKAVTLFERSARLAASLSDVQPPTAAFWEAYRLMETSILQLSSSLPPIHRRSVRHHAETLISLGNPPTRPPSAPVLSQAGSQKTSPTGSMGSDSPGTGTFSTFSASQSPAFNTPVFHPSIQTQQQSQPDTPIEIDTEYMLVHVVLRCASVQLYNIFAQTDVNSYAKALASAREAATIVAQVAEVVHDSFEYDLMLGPCLTLIADVLLREANHATAATPLGLGGGSGTMENVEPELEAVLFVLKAIATNSPLVQRQAALVVAARNVLVERINAVHHTPPQDDVSMAMMGTMMYGA